MGVYFGWTIVIVMSCRVYLNLAQVAHQRTMGNGMGMGMENGMGMDMQTMQTMEAVKYRKNPDRESTIEFQPQTTFGTIVIGFDSVYSYPMDQELKSQPKSQPQPQPQSQSQSPVVVISSLQAKYRRPSIDSLSSV
jgi:hypothetical protein